MWVDYNVLHLYITVNFTKIILVKIFSLEVYYMYLCAGMCTWKQVPLATERGFGFPTVRLLVVVSCPAWVLEAKLGFSQGALSHWDSLGTCVCLLFILVLNFNMFDDVCFSLWWNFVFSNMQYSYVAETI